MQSTGGPTLQQSLIRSLRLCKQLVPIHDRHQRIDLRIHSFNLTQMCVHDFPCRQLFLRTSRAISVADRKQMSEDEAGPLDEEAMAEDTDNIGPTAVETAAALPN